MAKIEFRSDINHISLPQFWHSTSSAGILDLAKARFAGAGFVGSRESEAGFGTAMFFRHDFRFWQPLAISAGNFGDFGNS
jgi:hypothetical protein